MTAQVRIPGGPTAQAPASFSSARPDHDELEGPARILRQGGAPQRLRQLTNGYGPTGPQHQARKQNTMLRRGDPDQATGRAHLERPQQAKVSRTEPVG